MANCPKCNAHLKITDWRPECPHCGVNMVYYGMEESLLRDAEKAEAEHARTQKALDRLKASSIGGPRQIARFILAILPVAGLFLPLAKMNISTVPFVTEGKEVSINILTIVMDYFMNLFDMNAITGTIGSAVLGKSTICFALSIVFLALSIVMGILNFGRSFCSSQVKSCKKNIIVSGISVVLALASAIVFSVFGSAINAVFPNLITVEVNFLFVALLCILHAPVIVMNVLCIKDPIVVKYKELPNYSEQAEEAEEPAAAAAE